MSVFIQAPQSFLQRALGGIFKVLFRVIGKTFLGAK